MNEHNITDINPVSDISILKEQLCIVEKSETFTAFIVIAVFISLIYVNTQKNILVCAIEGNQVNSDNCYQLRLLGSLLITSALIFFLQLTENELINSDCPDEKQLFNYYASFITLLATLMRFYLLLEYK